MQYIYNQKGKERKCPPELYLIVWVTQLKLNNPIKSGSVAQRSTFLDTAFNRVI
jgi:hypothetical protein